MWNGDGARTPVNEWDVAQREEALRRAGRKSIEDLEQGAQKQKGRGQKVREVTFFLGEILTLKGRRFKVSHVIGENAVVLEPIGEMVLKEGVGRKGQANMVGRRRRAG